MYYAEWLFYSICHFVINNRFVQQKHGLHVLHHVVLGLGVYALYGNQCRKSKAYMLLCVAHVQVSKVVAHLLAGASFGELALMQVLADLKSCTALELATVTDTVARMYHVPFSKLSLV